MKTKHPLILITLVLLLAISLVGSIRATAMPAQPELQILPSWAYYGAVQGDRLGIAVSGAGKVNGDAFSDLLVGADKGGLNREGWVGLFLGGPGGPPDAPAWQVLGEKKGFEFGAAVDGDADVNNDGYTDIVVGAPNYTGEDLSAEAGEGAVYVYHGGEAGPSPTWDWKVEGDLQGVRMGDSVAFGGYINSDDYADLIVGMPGFTNEEFEENAGAAFVYFGSETGLNTAYGWLDYGGQAGAQFGLAVGAAGDVNNDGYDDVLIGEPYYNNDPYMDAGAVYLYLGNQFSLSNVSAWSFIGYGGGDRLGTSVAGIGDVNGDLCDDIAIGAPGYNADMDNTGRVYVFYGCQNDSVSTLNTEPDWWYSYPQMDANTGIDVAGGGDTNNDTFPELLVGVHTYDDEQANEGAVLAFFGGPSGLPSQPTWMAEGNKNDTWFGYSVDGAGDINLDGFDDVLVGAPQFRYDELIKGAAFAYFGSIETSLAHIFLPFITR